MHRRWDVDGAAARRVISSWRAYLGAPAALIQVRRHSPSVLVAGDELLPSPAARAAHCCAHSFSRHGVVSRRWFHQLFFFLRIKGTVPLSDPPQPALSTLQPALSRCVSEVLRRDQSLAPQAAAAVVSAWPMSADAASTKASTRADVKLSAIHFTHNALGAISERH